MDYTYLGHKISKEAGGQYVVTRSGRCLGRFWSLISARKFIANRVA